MGLLSNLTLAYETLADDPIEMGIHYGQSILDLIAGPTESVNEHDYQARPQLAPTSRTITRSPIIAERLRGSPAVTRRELMNYVTRPVLQASRPIPERVLVGAL